MPPLELPALVKRAAITGAANANPPDSIDANASPFDAEEKAARLLAAQLGLQFLPSLNGTQISGREEDCLELLRREGPQVWACIDGASSTPSAVVVPNSRAAHALQPTRASAHPLKSRIRVATARTVRKALQERAAKALTYFATNGLFDLMPGYSARIRINSTQGVMVGSAFVVLAQLLWFHFQIALLTLHVLATVFFVGCTILRFAAALQPAPRIAKIPPPLRPEPVYTVLVALWREANMAPQLLEALSGLDWPKDRLEIKLICEADDPETIAAIESYRLAAAVEIIAVPACDPRTKPKALRYAMPMIRGEFVVLYDAEDIPHPKQLREAFGVFDRSPLTLGCLQAPLEIVNGQKNWLTRCFAFEYAALFRGLVPWLASRRLVFPLGGTSNHFRRAVLEAVGGWDPHNVTEDADLGIRLARMGYSAGTLTHPTYETAPDVLSDWFPQRARWNKGWLQTWLVHMRSPAQLIRDLGVGSFLITQFVLFGMVFSAIIHPLMVLAIPYFLYVVVFGMPLTSLDRWLVGVDLLSIIGGYAGFLFLGISRMRGAERADIWSIVAATPAYWLLISLASWKALRDLCLRPFHWDKTSHKPFTFTP
ncbi:MULTISPECIES: glycosyltransferase family 2 protein [Mesorhizobium]|uniref:Glycosyl transferase n=1 Tax=Mesorhizobium denitrificans TaxID=2294114 RepID=A0A371XD23_9HYPH|nr:MULTISPECIES: glycosyltransferase family 2 protein [Mesorhizobium]RFC67125.1 glycosyl transferase [Mesorhizobium denitrificans]